MLSIRGGATFSRGQLRGEQGDASRSRQCQVSRIFGLADTLRLNSFWHTACYKKDIVLFGSTKKR